MAHFLHFPLTAAKNLSQSDAKHLSAPERCYWVLSENSSVNGL